MEVSDVIFFGAETYFMSWEETVKLLRSPSITSPQKLWEILSQLSTPAAADFGYSLPCLFLGRKEDALLSSKASNNLKN